MTDYDGKQFNDPILRCDQCAKLVHRSYISVNGGCCHCGNKRFKNVRGIEGSEYYELKSGTLEIGIDHPYTIDPGFLAMFAEAEGVPNE